MLPFLVFFFVFVFLCLFLYRLHFLCLFFVQFDVFFYFYFYFYLVNPEITFFDEDEEEAVINARKEDAIHQPSKSDMTFDHKLTLPDGGTHTRGRSNVVHVARPRKKYQFRFACAYFVV